MGDINGNKDMRSKEEMEGSLGREQTKELLIKLLTKVKFRLKMEVSLYDGNLNVEEFLNWINTLDKYFDYEGLEDD